MDALTPPTPTACPTPTETPPAQAVASAIQNARPAGNTGIAVTAGTGTIGIIALFIVQAYHADIDPAMTGAQMDAYTGAVTILLIMASHLLSHFKVFSRLWQIYDQHAQQ